MKRFVQEARILAGLNHPNIAILHEFFEDVAGGFFMVMEWAGQYSLRDYILERVLTGHPLTEIEILDIARQACLGLSEAHRKGIVHRDVSPENVMFVTRQKTRLLKLIDFGIAKRPLMVDDQSYLTQTGQFLGKVRYCSPEQAAHDNPEELDTRSDLYSLGVVMYEMTTGRLPYEATTPFGYLKKQLLERPRPIPEDNLVSREFRSLLMQLMAKDRERRPPSAIQVLVAIDRLLNNAGAPGRPLEMQPPDVPHDLADWAEAGDGVPGMPENGPEPLERTHPSSAGGSQPSPVSSEASDSSTTHVPRALNRRSNKAAMIFFFLAAILAAGALLVHRQGTVPGQQPAPNGSMEPHDSEARIPDEKGTSETSDGAGHVLIQRHVEGDAPRNNSAETQVAQPEVPALRDTPLLSGNILVSSQPGGGRVFLDGKQVGKTPAHLEPIPVDVPHPLRISMEGFLDWSQRLRLEANEEVSLLAVMTPVLANLSISTEPPGALVYLGGKRVPGVTPVRIENLVSGKSYKLELELEGHDSWKKSIHLSGPGERRVRASLRKLVAYGSLLINSMPWTQITLDGNPVGVTPLALERVEAGSHDLVLSNDGIDLKTDTTRIEVEAGKETTRFFEFSGALAVDSDVPLRISIDGKPLGEFQSTEWSLLAGPHRITLSSRETRREQSRKILIKYGETLEIHNPLSDP